MQLMGVATCMDERAFAFIPELTNFGQHFDPLHGRQEAMPFLEAQRPSRNSPSMRPFTLACLKNFKCLNF